MMERSITCPQCGKTSYNPNDIRAEYCGACHKFHADMKPEKPKIPGWLPVVPIKGGHKDVWRCTAEHCGAFVRDSDPTSSREAHDAAFHNGKVDHKVGYAAYVAGRKVHKGASAEFVRGWWDAYDHGEYFGNYETFLAAPDDPIPAEETQP